MLVLVMALWNLAEAQRSFYASRPRSKLLPKFKQNETETTTENLVNRGGEEEENLFGNPGVDNRNTDVSKTNESSRFHISHLINHLTVSSLKELWKTKNF